MKVILSLLIVVFVFSACQKKQKTEVTPWGATVTTDAEGNVISTGDSTETVSDGAMGAIKHGGVMIMLTLSGPDTYYDYHGHGMGVQYLMCEKFAETLNATLRVDLCKDTADMLTRLKNGEGDVIAYPLDGNAAKGTLSCGDRWAVSPSNKELANAIGRWYKPTMPAEMKKQEEYMLSVASVTRHVYPTMLSAKAGQISRYDQLFRRYSSVAQMDWVLMAAQCYQESCFDPQAHSWAGACGLMQIIPSTADHLSLPRNQMYEPEPNIAASARYMKELQGIFSDIRDPQERIKFALAAYNGGYYHIRDAMALAQKYNGNSHLWNTVRHYVLGLSSPRYYRDPVVKNGYMRGTETANYVDMIMQRWQQYRHALSTGGKIVSTVKKAVTSDVVTPMTAVPHRAAKKNKWRND